MKMAILTLGLWITGGSIGLVEQTNSALDEALRAFGRKEYAHAREALQVFSKAHPDQAAYLYYYIGECYYQTNDLSNARKYFERAFATLFNKDEAADKLVAIWEKEASGAATEPYRIYQTNRIQENRDSSPDPRWEIAQPLGQRDPDEPLKPVGAGRNSEYLNGRYFLGCGHPSIAVYYLERGVVVNIPLPHRFDSENALLYYTKLAKAYREKAQLFQSRKFRLDGYDASRTQEVAVAINKYLEEHGKKEVAEAEQLAEHYRLKAIVVDARLGSKNPKPDNR
jgi:tetratricopeptide (TPR) repeat protein